MLILGILVHPTLKPDNFRGNRLFFRQLAEQSVEIGILTAFFSPQHVNWNRCKIRAFVFEPKSERWVLRRLPLPAVVYDRFFFNGTEPKNAHSFRKALIKRGIPIFNPIIGTKYRIHRQLVKDPLIARYLPETNLIEQGKDIAIRLKTWKKVYLKPVSGTKGRGIIRLSQVEKNQIYIEQVNQKKGRWATPRGALKWLKSVIKDGKYILQQDLDPARWNGKIFDLRILVQRDDAGKWQVTGAAARVAENGITCNVHTGAQAVPLETVLQESGVTISSAEIFDAGLLIAKRLNKLYPGLGELGLDFLIDSSGRLWFLEANPRPGRCVFRRIGDQASRLMAIRRPLEYAKFLATKRKAR